MKTCKYLVLIKSNDEMIFSSENKKKDVNEWVKAYEESEVAEEIKIYQRGANKKSYTLLFTDCRRKIGF